MKWQLLSFDDVFADESGGNIKTLTSEYLTKGKYPIIDQGQNFIAGFTNDASRICGNGKPAVIFGDHTRCIKFVDFPFCMGADGVKVLRPKFIADLKYLYHALRNIDIPSAGYDRHFKYLKRKEIPLAPLPEQRRIAEILDKAEALRAKRRTALAKLDTLAQSIFLDMFGDPARNPKRFPRVELSTLTRLHDSINYGVVQPGDDVDEGVPLIRVGDIIGSAIRTDGIKRISPQIEKQYQRSRLKGDEILVSCVGSIGFVALADSNVAGYNIARAVARIPPSDSVDRQYLASFLRTEHVQKYFVGELRTVSQPTLNIKQLSETMVMLPPLSLQQAFARRIEAIESLKAVYRTSSVKLESLFSSLQNNAFQGTL